MFPGPHLYRVHRDQSCLDELGRNRGYDFWQTDPAIVVESIALDDERPLVLIVSGAETELTEEGLKFISRQAIAIMADLIATKMAVVDARLLVWHDRRKENAHLEKQFEAEWLQLRSAYSQPIDDIDLFRSLTMLGWYGDYDVTNCLIKILEREGKRAAPRDIFLYVMGHGDVQKPLLGQGYMSVDLGGKKSNRQSQFTAEKLLDLCVQDACPWRRLFFFLEACYAGSFFHLSVHDNFSDIFYKLQS